MMINCAQQLWDFSEEKILGVPARMTDKCKNITLPQTSFAGGKYDICFRGPKSIDDSCFP